MCCTAGQGPFVARELHPSRLLRLSQLQCGQQGNLGELRLSRGVSELARGRSRQRLVRRSNWRGSSTAEKIYLRSDCGLGRPLTSTAYRPRGPIYPCTPRHPKSRCRQCLQTSLQRAEAVRDQLARDTPAPDLPLHAFAVYSWGHPMGHWTSQVSHPAPPSHRISLIPTMTSYQACRCTWLHHLWIPLPTRCGLLRAATHRRRSPRSPGRARCARGAAAGGAPTGPPSGGKSELRHWM